jgi:hypothetical protein
MYLFPKDCKESEPFKCTEESYLLYLLLVFNVVLGMELRALNMLSTWFTTELYTSPRNLIFIYLFIYFCGTGA